MKHQPGALEQRQSLELPQKIRMAELRIHEWVRHWGVDGVYVAFSGGKDSTVGVHLVRSLYPDVPAVFFDTGLEFPEIRAFVRSSPGVEVIRPDMSFREVLDRYGYPAVSKRVAQYVHEYRTSRRLHPEEGETPIMRLRRTGIRKNGTYTRLGKVSDKWQHLFDAPFNVSHKCCDALKKRPDRAYAKATGRKAFVFTMAEESQHRSLQWRLDGCNAFDARNPTSKPLSVWTEADIWAYLKGGNRAGEQIPYSSIYDMGYPRTGCVFCMFGVHLEHRKGVKRGDPCPNRFLKLERTHPKLHTYCMKPWEEGGLGLRRVLAELGVPWREEQLQLSCMKEDGPQA